MQAGVNPVVNGPGLVFSNINGAGWSSPVSKLDPGVYIFAAEIPDLSTSGQATAVVNLISNGTTIPLTSNIALPGWSYVDVPSYSMQNILASDGIQITTSGTGQISRIALNLGPGGSALSLA
jgi:hypothetical protein